MAKRELTKDERDQVHFYAEAVNAYQHNARMLQGKYISNKQAEDEYLDVASDANAEKFLAGKKLAKETK